MVQGRKPNSRQEDRARLPVQAVDRRVDDRPSVGRYSDGQARRQNLLELSGPERLAESPPAAFAPIVFAPSFLGCSPAIAMLRDLASPQAPTDVTVLITGEPGTGKELLARAFHDSSGRRGEFVAINVAGLSRELVDSELFGYVKGAFTNAHVDRSGLVTLAEKGTLFLDEIGELHLDLQPKLLRLLQERVARPVGGGVERPVDVRILAATNQNLLEAVRAGRFRRDLYDRVAETRLVVPPLRDRGEDVVLLARQFLEEYQGERPPRVLTKAAIAVLKAHRWPGNVRELQRVMRALAIYGKTPRIDGEEVLEVLEHPVTVQPRPELEIGNVLQAHGPATTQELVARFQVSTSSILRQLQPLRDSGMVGMRRVGRGNTFFWIGPAETIELPAPSLQAAPPEVSPDSPLPPELSIERLRALALKLASGGEVSRLALATAANISLRSSLRILTGLVEDGKLHPVGRGRSLRYVISEPG